MAKTDILFSGELETNKNLSLEITHQHKAPDGVFVEMVSEGPTGSVFTYFGMDLNVFKEFVYKCQEAILKIKD